MKDKQKFWVEVATTIIFSFLLLSLPFVCFWPELPAISDFWWIKLANWFVLPIDIALCVGVYVFRNDPNKDWLRKPAIYIAIAFAFVVMITAGEYRFDKSDNIHYDKTITK